MVTNIIIILFYITVSNRYFNIVLWIISAGLFGATGSYASSFYLAGILYITAGFVMIFAIWHNKRTQTSNTAVCHKEMACGSQIVDSISVTSMNAEIGQAAELDGSVQ